MTDDIVIESGGVGDGDGDVKVSVVHGQAANSAVFHTSTAETVT